jgi:ADP-heptose:LPS heptosyltransferase
MTGRLLVLRRGGLGDTLLLAPVLRALQRRHPDCAIDVAGVREFAAVLAHFGLCARALSSEDLATWRLRAGGPTPEWAAAYTQVVADEAALGAVAAPGRHVACFDPRPRTEAPLGQQLAEQLGLTLRWPQDAWLVPGPAPGRGAAVLAPGSGGRAKCWPQQGWLALAECLGECGDVAVVVGPTEIERDDPRRWPWPASVQFVVESEVVALAERMRSASAFVGNDSGPTHLAAMLGVPTVALFGPSVAAVFAPQGPCVDVVCAPDGDLAAVTAAEVAVAWRRVCQAR